MSYNGWTNYETWNTALWVDNEYSVYQDRQRVSRQEGAWDARRVREFCENWFPKGTPDIETLPYDDRDPIDWQEIADNWNEEREDG